MPLPPRANCISALRIDAEEHPGELLKAEWPKRYMRRAWIPQTMGDQVWALFEFHSEAERKDWEKNLSRRLTRCLDRDLIQYVRRYGWHVRDMNGFIITRSNITDDNQPNAN